MKAKLQSAINHVNRRNEQGLNDDDQVFKMVQIANKCKGYHFVPKYDSYEICTDLERLTAIVEKFGYWSEGVKQFNEILKSKKDYSYMEELNNQLKYSQRIKTV